jgi:hypothetical protein
LQGAIRRRAIAAVGQRDASPDAVKRLLPALNEMFDITATRTSASVLPRPVE